MSRSGYSDDIDDVLEYGRWRGVVASTIRGKRGQKFLKELADALDAMPEKKLITEQLKTQDGGFCTLGVLGEKKGFAIADIDPEDTEFVADQFDIAEPLVKEIVFLNDEACRSMTPEERWKSMRGWVKNALESK